MKIQQAKVTNFASYDTLHFDFANQGLTLISGPTGAGKSTVLDVVPWILYGVTAKGGSVEEILSWPGDKITEGTIWLDNVTISRKRGPDGKDNDLMFWPVDGKVTRGKDLKDTQKLINNFLGIDADQYLLGAYFHEFSETSRFFTTTAKNRRQLTENICDFSVPNKIKEAAKLKLKDLNGHRMDNEIKIRVKRGVAETHRRQITLASQESQHWVKTQADKLSFLVKKQRDFNTEKADVLSGLREKSKRFDKEKSAIEFDYRKQINALFESTKSEGYYKDIKEQTMELIAQCDDDICAHCGAPKGSVEKLALTEDLHATKLMEQENLQGLKKIKQLTKDRDKALAAINPYLDQIVREVDTLNTYAEQIEALQSETNPHEKTLSEARRQHVTAEKEIDLLTRKNEDFRVEISDLELLVDLTDVYRTSLVNTAIVDLERKTNNYLSNYFDAEIKVEFESTGADKLEVTISKDGNHCSYTQLSRGQRQLLRLCFAVSVMKAAQNYSGVDLDTIFLDEFTDGLDEGLEIKTFALLQELAQDHANVFAVDHSEALKSMFTNRYNVELVNGVSRIAEA